MYLNVWLISSDNHALDGQSKLQMFTLSSRRHVGVPWRYTNMAATYWALLILCKTFRQIFEDKENLQI